jgi:hypothetical protein
MRIMFLSHLPENPKTRCRYPRLQSLSVNLDRVSPNFIVNLYRPLF